MLIYVYLCMILILGRSLCYQRNLLRGQRNVVKAPVLDFLKKLPMYGKLWLGMSVLKA